MYVKEVGGGHCEREGITSYMQKMTFALKFSLNPNKALNHCQSPEVDSLEL